MTDPRDLIQRLADTLERAQNALHYEGGCTDATDKTRRNLLAEARSYLAQSEPAADLPPRVGHILRLLLLAGAMADSALRLIGGKGLNGQISACSIDDFSHYACDLRLAVEKYNNYILEINDPSH